MENGFLRVRLVFFESFESSDLIYPDDFIIGRAEEAAVPVERDFMKRGRSTGKFAQTIAT